MGIICPAFTGQFSAFGHQAFAGLCSAVQTMLNSELSSVGIAEVTLTPENYTETLSGLKETLNGMISENCLSKIFSKAVEEKVTAAIGKIDDLQAQLDDFQTFYDGVAAYTGGVDSAATGAAALRDGVNTLHQNTDVDSVQFVIKTAAIEKLEEPVVDETPVVQRNFWQKLLHLFGLD